MIDEKTIAELKAKHGESLVAVSTPDGTEIVLRKPKRIEYDRWINQSEKDGNVAAMQLAKACRVHPDESIFDSVLEKYPAILRCTNGFVPSIIELAGVGEAQAKKL